MEKLTGRTAITALAEVELGLRELTDIELEYATKQANSLCNWFHTDKGISRADAKAICLKLFNQDIEFLKQPTFDEFLWSRRNGEVGDTEIDLIKSREEDPSTIIDQTQDDLIRSEARLAAIADRNIGDFNWDHWRAGLELAEKIDEWLIQFVDKQLSSSDKNKLRQAKQRINTLRYGKKVMKEIYGKTVEVLVNPRMMTYRQYAPLYNLIQSLLGETKRLPDPSLIAKDQEGEESYIDAMDNAMHNDHLITEQLQIQY